MGKPTMELNPLILFIRPDFNLIQGMTHGHYEPWYQDIVNPEQLYWAMQL